MPDRPEDDSPPPRAYPLDSVSAHPPYLTEHYFFTRKRAPFQPLHVIPQTVTELAGPAFVSNAVGPGDHDLTRQHAGEPIGERIIVTGRVLDEDGNGVPDTLVEIWQANAAGRYAHELDAHAAPLDPNFTGAGRCVTDAQGAYRFVTIKPGPYPVVGLDNVWRASHIHLSLFGPSFLTRLVTQMYFPGDPLIERDTIYNTAPAASRATMVASLDWSETRSEWAVAYRLDLVLRGRAATHFDDSHG
jgi:protocatechuate 3,4-dioxygenase beta subunit